METLWARWKHIARKIGNVQARVILTVFYFSIALPLGVGAGALSDPLRLKRHRVLRGWQSRSESASDLAGLRRQS